MIISVNGFEDAKSYPVMYNNSEILMDNNRDVFYVKSVDGLGKVNIETYRFEKVENEKPLSADNFVTREQFSEFTGKIDMLLAQLSASALSVPVEAQSSAVEPETVPEVVNTGGGGKFGGKQRA